MISVLLAQILIGAVLVIAFVYASVSKLWQSDSDHLGPPLPSRHSFEGEPWWERQLVSRRMSIDAGVCRVCRKPTTTQCSKCKSVKYCSIACQRQDWGNNHKFECPNLQKLAAAASSSGNAVAAPTKPPPPDPNEDAPVPRHVLFPYQHYLQLCHNRTSCRKAPVGLTNLGNNCYANAALQCLLVNRPLRAYLDQGLHSSSCNKPNRHEWCLLCELQILCKRMAEARPGDDVSIRPLLRHLRRFAKTLSYGRQEDAHEFFYSLLNTMEAIQLTNYGGKERYDMRTQETTLVHHVFGSYLRSQVICGGCGAASRRFEAALDVQLEVPPGVDRLEDALARHTAEEVLDGDNRYACDGCKQRCRATRSTRFEVAPNSLVLCLKRFGTGRFGKINKMLVYGEHLDLSSYMAQQAMDDGQVTYTLSGVIVHLDQMNSTSFGHYNCFVRTAENRWYVCDDAHVAPTSLSRVLSQNAYMLFYQRDTPKPAPQPGYKRIQPLTPAAAAAQAVPAAKLDVAGNRTAAVLESDIQQRRQDQQQQQQLEIPGQMVDGAAAAASELQQQVQQQMLPQLAREQLARVSTAPAALVRLADERVSIDSKDEETVSVSSSANLANGSECSTHSGGIAAAAAQPQHPQHSDSPVKQQQQPVDGTAALSHDAAAELAAAHAQSSNGSHSSLPLVEYQLSRCGPELLQLRAHLPGVMRAADVTVDVVNAGPQLQRLQLKVPGRYAPLDVSLSQLLAADSLSGAQSASRVPGSGSTDGDSSCASASAGQVVAAVSGKLYRKRQMLSLKLHLVDASEYAASDGMVHWHSTDSLDAPSSSGSESDGSIVMAMSSIRSVMSEMDLSSFFGQHSSGHLMQQLKTAGQNSQQEQGLGVDALSSNGAVSSKQKLGSSKSAKKSGSKKSKGKKKK